ncbi:MAG: M28 family peptidase, partial [Ginsengibacter sp.]
MNIILTLIIACFTSLLSFAQNIDKIINAIEVERIEKVLSSDDMQGRKTFTPSIDRAADFIAGEFKSAGLKYFDSLKSYRQTFSMVKANQISAAGKINDKEVKAENIIDISTEPNLEFDEKSGFTKIILDSSSNLMREAFKLLNENKKYVVFVNSFHTKNFNLLKLFNRESFENKAPVVFVLSDENPSTYHFDIKNEITSSPLSNVIGILPGTTKKDEYVIFSAHYDHLGIGKPDARGDSIYNGANDDASGTTAV